MPVVSTRQQILMKQQNFQKVFSSKVLVCVVSAAATLITLAALGVYSFIECPTQVSELAGGLFTTSSDLTKVLTRCSEDKSNLKQELRIANQNVLAEINDMEEVRKTVKGYGEITVYLKQDLGLIQYLNITTDNYTSLLREAVRELTEVYDNYESIDTLIKELNLDNLNLKEAADTCAKNLTDMSEQLRTESQKLQDMNDSYVKLVAEVNALKENLNPQVLALNYTTLESEVNRLGNENKELQEVLAIYTNSLNNTLNNINVCVNTSQLLKEILSRQKFSRIWDHCSKETLECTHCMQNWVEHSSRCFFLSADIKNWTIARDECVGLNGDLANVYSYADQEFLYNLIRNNRTYMNNWAAWIGLNDLVDEGHFVWVNGEDIGVAYWGGVNPDNAIPVWDKKKRGQDCVTIEAQWDVNKSWDDVICWGPRNYICETAALKVTPPT